MYRNTVKHSHPTDSSIGDLNRRRAEAASRHGHEPETMTHIKHSLEVGLGPFVNILRKLYCLGHVRADLSKVWEAAILSGASFTIFFSGAASLE